MTREPVTSVDAIECDPEWVGALLEADAARSAPSPIADDGFTTTLMSQLPPQRQRPRYRWIVPVMAIIGFVVGLGWLSGGEELSMLLTGLLQTRSLSLQHLLMAVLPLGVLYWLAFGVAWQET